MILKTDKYANHRLNCKTLYRKNDKNPDKFFNKMKIPLPPFCHDSAAPALKSGKQDCNDDMRSRVARSLNPIWRTIGFLLAQLWLEKAEQARLLERCSVSLRMKRS